MSTIERPALTETLVEGQAVQITAAKIVAPFQIELRFSDGSQRVVDFAAFLNASQHPSIRAFLDPHKFATFSLEGGELVWGDYELCFPIADLYEGRL